jgi:[protein-PII] uridylyltransferase
MIRRSDISNMQVLLDLSNEFFLTTFPSEYLDFLYLVTYADIAATNPKNFSGYLSGLLTQVYKNIQSLLSRKIDKNYHKTIFKELIANLQKSGYEEFVDTFIQNLGDRYLLSHDENEIIQDFQTLGQIEHGHRIEVKVYNDYFKVKFFLEDKLGLFSMLSGILLLNGADIVRADIHTYQSRVLDEFYITRIFGLDVDEKTMKDQINTWQEDLEKLYTNYKDNFVMLGERITAFKKRIKRVSEVFRSQTEISIMHRDDGEYTITISCTDRPALLYDVTSLIAENNIEIQNAIIDTSGWYVQDSFEVKSGSELGENSIAILKEKLMHIIEMN